jgi:O-antigen/teichoic acid export membrane protein
VSLSFGVVEILLILLLVPQGGYLVMSAILSAYLAATVGVTAWRGWREIRDQEAVDKLLIEPASNEIQ